MESDEFKKRFLPFHRLIYRIAFGVSGNRTEAEDIAQEVFEKLWKQRDSLHAVENEEAYIVALSKNQAIDHVRKNCRHFTVSISGTGHDIESPESAETRMEENETRETICRLMETLPQTQQEALRLRHFGDFSISHIAEAMQQSEVNVRQLLSRARKTIKKQIERTGMFVY